jgi:DNA-binding NarL/FixJ family response regulator
VTIAVLVADDDEIVRNGIALTLNAVPDIHVVGEAADGRIAVEMARRHLPDVVVMDIRMPVMDGITATRALTEEIEPGDVDRLMKVLVLTTFAEDEAVYGAIGAGASAFLTKSASSEDLIRAVRLVAAGGGWLDSEVAPMVMERLAQMPSPTGGPSARVELLTPREREVMAWVALGLSNKEICSRLVLSEATVKTHVGRIIAKTGSRDRSQVVGLAYETGLVVPGERGSTERLRKM